MHLWNAWWAVVRSLRPACSRQRSFLWLAATLAAMSVRPDLAGVTSLIRALGFDGFLYDRLLDAFHSSAIRLSRLTVLWARVILACCRPFAVIVNGRHVILGDGLKAPKAGKKMPAVKLLHQESDSNTKPTYIYGHHCQVVTLLVGAARTFFALPLAGRIHEGAVFSNRDRRTLLDKMLLLLEEVAFELPFYFVADAYYACRTMVRGLLEKNQHLITRVKTNAVAYELPDLLNRAAQRGRKPKYGKKIRLRELWDSADLVSAPSPVAGEEGVLIRYQSRDLLWRPVGVMIRFVAVVHPHRGRILLMSTDRSLAPLEILRIYSLRFRIEVTFKQSLHTLGAFSYHFWVMCDKALRRSQGDQHYHRLPEELRRKIRSKLDAYHRHIQIGLIAQGLVQYLSMAATQSVWGAFGSWIRTRRTGVLPSEQVTTVAMRNALPEFLGVAPEDHILAKFVRERIDPTRAEGIRLAA